METKQVTRELVNGMCDNKTVRLSDSDEETGLDLFCYVKCSNEDDETVKRCRGVVFHGNELVMEAFPYTAEYNHTEVSELERVLSDFGKFTFFDSYEGTLLRVFNFDGKWFLTTHRKLNAFRSKWSSQESYGSFFKKALSHQLDGNKEFQKTVHEEETGDSILEKFCSTLDPCHQYMFLLLNSPDTRIVCLASENPTVYHVGTFVNGELDLEYETFIQRPTRHNWMNIDEMIEHVKNCDYHHFQGVIAFGPDNTQVKVLNKTYQDWFAIRGNEASKKFRYLQLRMDKERLDKLYQLYPESEAEFDEHENMLYEIAQSIYNCYVTRFIRKEIARVPNSQYNVIRECHEWHLQDRRNNRISLDKVISVLNSRTPTQLNHMIRDQRKLEKEKKGEKEKRDSTPVPSLLAASS